MNSTYHIRQMALSVEHQARILTNLLTRGASLLAEVFRLHTILPHDLYDVARSKFKLILLDFAYFEASVEYDQKIEENAVLRDMDKDFVDLHHGFICQFSRFMNSLCGFMFDLSEYTQKYTVVDIFIDAEWNRIHILRTEVLYHLGVILIFLDQKFVPLTREAVFVAGQRLGEKFTSTHFETCISLLRERKDIFENCFVHLGIHRKFVENVLHYVRTSNLIQAQDVTLSNKMPSLVYIFLWFIPHVLRDEGSFMRQLVDAFFTDQWILNLHFELTTNILDKWKNYKPAIMALNGIITSERVAMVMQRHIEILKNNKLPSGLLSLSDFESYRKQLIVCEVLQIELVEDLERFKKISIQFDAFKCLLNLVKFEYKFKQSAWFIIKNKMEEAMKLKSDVVCTINQVIIILEHSRESWKTKVKTWMEKIKQKLSEVEVSHASSIKSIDNIKLRIEEIAEITSDDQKVINQYLGIVIKNLDCLKAVYQLNVDFINSIDVQCDSAYLWECVVPWMEKLENLLQSNPVMVKYLFFKLLSPIKERLNALAGCKVADLSVFYHKILESYLKKIVQAIPRTVFIELEELQSLLMDDDYCFIEKCKVKTVIQTERRRKLAEKTCKISKLSLGISNMCLRKLGPLEIKPELMLYDGLKKELNFKLNHIFLAVIPTNTFFTVLKKQREELSRFRKAFLFVCQQIGINGVQLWQSEMSAIISAALNTFFTRLGFEKIPIPLKSTALHAFVMKMIQCTDPTCTIFSIKSLEWWNTTKNKLEYSANILLVAHEWIPSFFLVAIRRIIQRVVSNDIAEMGAILMRNQNLGCFDHAFSVDHLITTPEFSNLCNMCLPFIFKIGQYVVIDEAIQISISANAISDVNLLRRTAKAALEFSQLTETRTHIEATEIPQYLECVLEKTGLIGYSQTTVPLPPYSKLRNSVILFSILSHCLSTNVITSKRGDFVDSFALVKGVEKIKCCLELNYQFEFSLSTTCGDCSGYLVARKLKIDNVIYPFKNTPEPQRK